MINSIQIGKRAPNFVPVGVSKNRLGKIRLSDYSVKKYVILLFYPANFTSVSSTELIQLSDRISEFRKFSTQILAISVDSPFSHFHYLLSKRNQGGVAQFNYPLISDFNRTITKKYDLLTDDVFQVSSFLTKKVEFNTIQLITYYVVEVEMNCSGFYGLFNISKKIQVKHVLWIGSMEIKFSTLIL